MNAMMPAPFRDDATTVRLVDAFGRTHELRDDGSDWLEGLLDFVDGPPMRYWIPRYVSRAWKPAAAA